MKPFYKFVLTACSTTFFTLGLLSQNAGDLDFSFGSTGTVITDLGDGYDQCFGLVIQSDQKVVIGGRSIGEDGYSHPTLIRMNTDGSLDNSFDQDGIATVDIIHGVDLVQGDPISIQPDGKLLLASNQWLPEGTVIAVTRFNTDGSLDTSFGIEGTASADVSGYMNTAHSMIRQVDGKIVLVGYGKYFANDVFRLLVVRLLENGELDLDFGDGGSLLLSDEGYTHMAMDVAQQSDGKLVLTGQRLVSGFSEYCVIRLNEDGSFDSSFGNGGVSNIDLGYGYDIPTHVEVRVNGSILVGGLVDLGSGTNSFALLGLNSNGELDSTFGNNGLVIGPFEGLFDSAQSVVESMDGKIILVGHHVVGNFIYGALLRYHADGTLDTSFGEDGLAFIEADSYHLENVKLQSNGKIVVCGWMGYSDTNEHHFSASRLYYDDALRIDDFSSDFDALLIYPNPGKNKIYLKWKSLAFELKVYDMWGNLIFETSKAGMDPMELDVSEFAPGIYNVAVVSADSTTNKQFIVN
jgi:uncharacterized delta-60 repeat protein